VSSPGGTVVSAANPQDAPSAATVQCRQRVPDRCQYQHTAVHRRVRNPARPLRAVIAPPAGQQVGAGGLTGVPDQNRYSFQSITSRLPTFPGSLRNYTFVLHVPVTGSGGVCR